MMDRMITANHGEKHPTQLMFVAVRTVPVPSVKHTHTDHMVFSDGYVSSCRLESDKQTREHAAALKTPHALWDILSTLVSPQRPVWIFAHNLSRVFTVIGGWLRWRQGTLGVKHDEVAWERPGCPIDPNSCKPGLIVDGDPPVIFDLWHKAGGKTTWVDTRNYWHVPQPSFDTAQAEHDYIREQVTGLIAEHKQRQLGNFGLTAASIGWNAWRHKFMTKPVFIHGDDKTDALERKSYFGGWTACFRTGKIAEPCVQLDVNGLYPFVMATRQLPFQLDRSANERHADTDHISCDPWRCIATVSINSPGLCFPRRIGERKSQVDCGRFHTVLGGPELHRAISAGVVEQIGEWSSYQLAVMFADYVEYFADVRREAESTHNQAAASLAKAAAVGLYGRFARCTPKWEALSDTTALPERWTALSPEAMAAWLQLTSVEAGRRVNVCGNAVNTNMLLRLVGRHWQINRQSTRHPDSFVAIASFITSYAREYMQSIVAIAGKDNVFRVATDSIITNRDGFTALQRNGMIHPTALGKLKIEASGNDAEFFGVHCFRLGDKWTRGGLSSDFEVLPDGTVREYEVEGLDRLIISSYHHTFRRFSIDRQNVPGYHSPINGPGVRDQAERGLDEKGTENGRQTTDIGETDPEQADTGTD